MTQLPHSPPTAQSATDRPAGPDWDGELRGHAGWLRSVLAARVGRDEVEDVLQEVALAAVGATSPPRDPDKVAPWLYRLAVRQALLYRRRLGRQRKLLDRVAAHVAGEPVEQATPTAWLLADERQSLVRVAMARLPKRDREILALKYSQDWTYQEIARHLGTTQSAVEARLHRARKRLRQQLASLEVTAEDSTSAHGSSPHGY